MEGLDLAKAERMARERDRKYAEKMPLFADQLPPTTAEQIKAAFDKHRAEFEACERRLQERGDDFRAMVKEIADEIEFAALDSRRLNLPRGPEYHADFWRARYEERAKRHCDSE